MLSRIFIRYASRSKFTLPAVNFQYGKEDKNLERIVMPVQPKECDKRYSLKTSNKGKGHSTVETKRNNITRKQILKRSTKALGNETDFNISYRNKRNVYEDEGENGTERYKGGDYKYNKQVQLVKSAYVEGASGNHYNPVRSREARAFHPLGEVLYGIHPVLLALKAGRRKIHCLYYKAGLEERNENILKIIKLCNVNNVNVLPVESSWFKRYIKKDQVHQGVCCDVSPLQQNDLREEDITQSHAPVSESSLNCESEIETHLGVNANGEGDLRRLWLYLDKIQDPMNFGAILRSAYYFGVEKVLTSGEHSCGVTPVVSKASSGVAEVLPVNRVRDPMLLLRSMADAGWDLVSSSTASDSTPVTDFQPQRNTLLLVGNEGTGISTELLNVCQSAVRVHPARAMPSEVDCLNVSVATAIILHNFSVKLKTR